jgi:excisionase family DNA binding protein
MELLNVQEAARELKLSPHTIRAWIYQKRLPLVRLGRRVLLRRQDVEEFVNKNLIEAYEGKQRGVGSQDKGWPGLRYKPLP